MTDQPRSCANCACFAHMLPDGTILAPDSTRQDAQTVCRRNPPGGRWTRVDVPVYDAQGEPVMRRPGVPRLEPKQVLEIGYPPAVHGGVCFDGWRPLGTRPGENAHLREVLPMVAEVARGNMAAAKRLGEALLDNLMSELPPGRRTS